MDKFGSKTKSMTSTKWGNDSLVPGGGIKYYEMINNDQFKVVGKFEKNITNDENFGYHTSGK